MRYQIFRGQIDHTLAGADEVVGGLAHLAQAQHAAPAQPPRRRHGRQVRRAVWVQGADEGYGCSEIEDGRLDRLVHAQTIPVIAQTAISASCGQTKSRYALADCAVLAPLSRPAQATRRALLLGCSPS